MSLGLTTARDNRHQVAPEAAPDFPPLMGPKADPELQTFLLGQPDLPGGEHFHPQVAGGSKQTTKGEIRHMAAETMTVQPMQWKPIADINEVPKFSEADRECFTEIRDVLQKHGCLDRFGIMLVHRHFDINEDEEMLEYTDFANRTLTIKPVKKADIEWDEVTTTNWKFTEGDEVAVRGCVCARNASGHLGRHWST